MSFFLRKEWYILGEIFLLSIFSSFGSKCQVKYEPLSFFIQDTHYTEWTTEYNLSYPRFWVLLKMWKIQKDNWTIIQLFKYIILNKGWVVFSC